jgi:hypothetical protein
MAASLHWATLTEFGSIYVLKPLHGEADSETASRNKQYSERQTRREAGAQSHGALEVSRATCTRDGRKEADLDAGDFV